MNRRLPHVPDPTTVEALYALSEGRAWRKLPGKLNQQAEQRGLSIHFAPESFGSLHGLAKGIPGSVRAETEDQIRAVLGLLPIHAPSACPTCGKHHSVTIDGLPIDCHGKTVYARPTAGRKDTHRPSYRPRLDPSLRGWSPAKIECACRFYEAHHANVAPCNESDIALD